MKKTNLIAVVAVCQIVFSNSALAYGGMYSTASAMGGGPLTTGYSFSLSIKLPIEASIRPDVVLPASSVVIPNVDFDATQIPVHELPPLPLTLDTPDQES